MTGLPFPRLSAKDLFGAEAITPDCFGAEPAIVLVAFRRQQQAQVDSWLPWLEHEHLRFFEMPCIARAFAPFRPLIDGGMAAGVGTDEARGRTLTYYGDLRKVTGLLEIRNRSEITVLAVEGGTVTGRATGSFSDDRGRALLARGDLDAE